MGIPKQCESEAIKLLQFVVFADRPLRLSELVDAVATEPDDVKPFDEENRFTPSEVLLECCPGLLRVTYGDEHDIAFHDGSGFECDNDERYVQLAHSSVQEYLLSDRKQNLYKQHFRAVAANAKIAQICLSYLWSNMDSDQNLEEMSIKYPFTQYATWVWEWHISVAGDSEDCTFSWILKATTDRRFLSLLMDERNLAVDPKSEKQLEYMMYLICKCGLTRSVGSLLDNGFDPSTVCYGYGETVLCGASSYGHVETVRALLDHGANVDAQDLNGKTALDFAARGGYLQVVKLLVTHTLRVNVSEGYYESALEAAAHNGHLRIVKYLLDKVDYKNIGMNRSRPRADVGQTDDLCAACAAGRVERVRTLLEDDGAGVMSSKTTEDALRLARHHRQPEIIQMLNNYSGIDYGFDRDDLFGTALAAAAYGGHTDIVRLLLKTNLDIDDAQWYQHAGPGEAFHGTPLQAASRRGHLETVRVLLECGARVNAKTGSHGYALHGALAKGHKDVSLLLLKYGADIRAIGGRYGTALHAAALGGNLEVVKMCLKTGMDVDMLNEKHETALSIVADDRSHLDLGVIKFPLDQGARDLKVIKFLLDHGANINHDPGRYYTPLEGACNGDHLELVKLLVHNGVDISFKSQLRAGAINIACERGSHELIAYLISQGADVNDIDDGVLLEVAAKGDVEILKLLVGRFSTSMMKKVCSSGRTNSVRLLLEHGIDVESTEQDHGGLLHDACIHDNEELVKLLLDQRADVNARGGLFGTALQAAADYPSTSMVELLLEFGADLNILGGEHGSALSAASMYGSLEMVRILLEYGANVNIPGLHHNTSLRRVPTFEYLDEDSQSPGDGIDFLPQANPLCNASYSNVIEMVQLLLARGAISNSQRRPYWQALLIAVFGVYRDVAVLLFEMNTKSLHADLQAYVLFYPQGKPSGVRGEMGRRASLG
ncbi:hypothetical protein E4T47_05701 [Aureobasidium subglaciale]|nr:hypothetical protein E4T47_05701 [Aureobasidium subglaciale]